VSDQKHWNKVYGAREEAALTWFQDRPEPSLSLVRTHAPTGLPIVDVGGGASRLVDHLSADGRDVTVLDLSGEALQVSRDRLDDPDAVTWVTGDVTAWQPDRAYGLWHDRAVFHFLTDGAQRAGYFATLDAALAPQGVAVIMTFALDGPETCSNLPVIRYSPDSLIAEAERQRPGAFRLIGDDRFVHETPKGNEQPFQISILARTAR